VKLQVDGPSFVDAGMLQFFAQNPDTYTPSKLPPLGATEPSINSLVVSTSGPFSNAISGCMGDTMPDNCYDGNAAGSVLGLAAAVIANKTGKPVSTIMPNTDPRVAAACLSRASNKTLGIRPDLSCEPGSLAAQLCGDKTSVPMTSSQQKKLTKVASELTETNKCAGATHEVNMNGIIAAVKDIPEEVAASHQLAHEHYGSVVNPIFVQGLAPDNVTFCPLETAGVPAEARTSIQKQIRESLEIVRRQGGACVHALDTHDAETALEGLFS